MRITLSGACAVGGITGVAFAHAGRDSLPAVNGRGGGLRDALDPRLRRQV